MDNSKDFVKACQDLQWNYDTGTPHRSETNDVAERAFRRVKEGPTVALAQRGLPDDWRSGVSKEKVSVKMLGPRAEISFTVMKNLQLKCTSLGEKTFSFKAR